MELWQNQPRGDRDLGCGGCWWKTWALLKVRSLNSLWVSWLGMLVGGKRRFSNNVVCCFVITLKGEKLIPRREHCLHGVGTFPPCLWFSPATLVSSHIPRMSMSGSLACPGCPLVRESMYVYTHILRMDILSGELGIPTFLPDMHGEVAGHPWPWAGISRL